MVDEPHPPDVEAELDRALDRLPARAVPPALRQRLEALVNPASSTSAAALSGGIAVPKKEGRRGSTWAASFVSACAAAALVLVVDRWARPDRRLAVRRSSSPRPSTITFASSAARIQSTSRAAASIRSNPGSRDGSTSRRASPSRGDDDFPLVGGSVGYFRDCKAAVFVFKRRLHTITLLVFPPEGLAWPNDDLSRVGRLSVSEATRAASPS